MRHFLRWHCVSHSNKRAVVPCVMWLGWTWLLAPILTIWLPFVGCGRKKKSHIAKNPNTSSAVKSVAAPPTSTAAPAAPAPPKQPEHEAEKPANKSVISAAPHPPEKKDATPVSAIGNIFSSQTPAATKPEKKDSSEEENTDLKSENFDEQLKIFKEKANEKKKKASTEKKSDEKKEYKKDKNKKAHRDLEEKGTQEEEEQKKDKSKGKNKDKGKAMWKNMRDEDRTQDDRLEPPALDISQAISKAAGPSQASRFQDKTAAPLDRLIQREQGPPQSVMVNLIPGKSAYMT